MRRLIVVRSIVVDVVSVCSGCRRSVVVTLRRSVVGVLILLLMVVVIVVGEIRRSGWVSIVWVGTKKLAKTRLGVLKSVLLLVV